MIPWKWETLYQRAEQEAWNDVTYAASAYEVLFFFFFLNSKFVIQHFLLLPEYEGENSAEKVSQNHGTVEAGRDL